MKDFFVSYTAADKAWATWIAYILEDDGYTVTIQEWDFRPGSNFAIEMDKALKQSPRMIAVLSPAYLKAKFPAPEWAAAFASDPEGAKNALVPIMVEECSPEGLLSQVVQIRIQGKDEVTAREMILEGVRRERSKPTAPPPFPGPSASPAPGSPPAVSFPAGTAASGPPVAGRLRWQSPAPPVTVSWHRDLDNSARGMQQRAAAVEVHLAFSDDDARLQVSELGELRNLLPDHGRKTGIFTRLEALESHADSAVVRVTSSGWGNEKGLAVTRSGQRSTWAPLPKGQVGFLLDIEHLVGQVTGMLDALTALNLPQGPLVVPAIGLDPATMISYGSVARPSNTAAIGITQPDHIHVAPDEAIEYNAVVTRSAAVAAELVARLVADHRGVTGLR
ncbi:hypothetical protein GCM10027610_104300 [Dactylosporangium cerinum]